MSGRGAGAGAAPLSDFLYIESGIRDAVVLHYMYQTAIAIVGAPKDTDIEVDMSQLKSVVAYLMKKTHSSAVEEVNGVKVFCNFSSNTINRKAYDDKYGDGKAQEAMDAAARHSRG